ncbi:prenyltransferase [bacterium]|nr:prenyltransferase [bacterium]
MSFFKQAAGLLRAPFLILAPVCAAVGAATAWHQTHEWRTVPVLIVILGATAAHACVNVFNEYFDFRSGLDARTRRTPFSGGSGTLQADPEKAPAALALGILCFLITAAIGLYFIKIQGWLILPIGLFGLFIAVTYTVWWVKHPVLCLAAPGLGFGVLMVTGSHFALTGTVTAAALAASLVPTFLVSDLLLLNQFPDVEADRTAGRRHFPVRIGREKSAVIYGVFLLLPYLIVPAAVLLRVFPAAALLMLLTVPLSAKAYRLARRNAEHPEALIPALGLNVIIVLLTPALLALGLFIAG